MANNDSLVGGESLMQKIDNSVLLVQIFVALFLSINFFLIITFFMKHCFYTTMRYIFFAITLLSDCLILILTDLLLILTYFELTVQIWLCLLLCLLSSVYTLVTPFTLMAMSLERYVAICIPLRHGELCSTRNSLHCILIIHSLSSLPCIVIVSVFCASASVSLYKQYTVCNMRVLVFHSWQRHLMSAINQLYFLIMSITIVFSYIKIMKVAKAASGKDKKATWKALRTVILHAFQLLLCLIQLWCPFIEAAIFQIDLILFINVRYFNYITFYLAPRCLSPLVYGLRDDKFFLALKYYAFCGLYKKTVF